MPTRAVAVRNAVRRSPSVTHPGDLARAVGLAGALLGDADRPWVARARESYSLQEIIDLDEAPSSFRAFSSQVRELAPTLMLDPDTARRYDSADALTDDHITSFREFIETYDWKDGGKHLASAVNRAISDASRAYPAHEDIARASFQLASAIRGLAQRCIDFGTDDPREIDARFDDLILLDHGDHPPMAWAQAPRSSDWRPDRKCR